MRTLAASSLSLILCLALITSGCRSEQSVPEKKQTPVPERIVELQVSGFKSGSELGAIPELNEKFMKENPGIKVTYEGMPGAQFKDYIRTKFAASSASDVVMEHPGSELNNYAKAGYLMDLSQESWVADFSAHAIDSATYTGKVYGVPNDIVVIGVYFNKDIFQALSIDVPLDWDDFLHACAVIKAARLTPISIGNNDGYMTLLAFLSMAPGTVYLKFPDLDDQLNARTATFSGTWDSMVKKWFALEENGYLTPQSTSVSHNQAQNDFASEKSAMYIDGSWAAAGILTANKKLELGMFTMPSNNKNDPLVVSADVGTVWSINAKTKNADAAKKYLAFWAREENLQTWQKSQGAFSTFKSKPREVEPEFSIISEQLSKNASYRFLNEGWNQGEAATAEISRSAQGVYLKAITPAQMLRNIDAAWDNAEKK